MVGGGRRKPSTKIEEVNAKVQELLAAQGLPSDLCDQIPQRIEWVSSLLFSLSLSLSPSISTDLRPSDDSGGLKHFRVDGP